MEWFFDRKSVSNLDAVLPLYKASELGSPTRSTVPLFSLLKHGNGLWNSVVNELITPCINLKGHLEFTVNPQDGKGTPSHTDLMLTNGINAVAFEAKWTEPRYETVREWLDSENRRRVVAGWLSLIRPNVGRTLSVEEVGDTVYQMVHRAASACSVTGIPTMAYSQFAPLPMGCKQEPTLMRDLIDFHSLLGTPETLRFYRVEVLLAPTNAFEATMTLPKSSASTAESVKSALRDGPLFRFVDYHVHRIHGGLCS
jgi:hypothetical protein